MNEIFTYIYVVKLVKPETFGRMSSKEETIIDEHFKFLKRGLTEGKVILAGRCEDQEFG